MARNYTKVEQLADIVRERKERGETYREIAESYGLTHRQIKKLMERQRAKKRRVAAGDIVRPKGRPRKEAATQEVQQHNELIRLRMTVDLLRNFLSEVGRR